MREGEEEEEEEEEEEGEEEEEEEEEESSRFADESMSVWRLGLATLLFFFSPPTSVTLSVLLSKDDDGGSVFWLSLWSWSWLLSCWACLVDWMEVTRGMFPPEAEAEAETESVIMASISVDAPRRPLTNAASSRDEPEPDPSRAWREERKAAARWMLESFPGAPDFAPSPEYDSNEGKDAELPSSDDPYSSPSSPPYPRSPYTGVWGGGRTPPSWPGASNGSPELVLVSEIKLWRARRGADGSSPVVSFARSASMSFVVRREARSDASSPGIGSTTNAGPTKNNDESYAKLAKARKLWIC